MKQAEIERREARLAADAGYRSEESLKNAPIELVVALGREGKEHAERFCGARSSI